MKIKITKKEVKNSTTLKELPELPFATVSSDGGIVFVYISEDADGLLTTLLFNSCRKHPSIVRYKKWFILSEINKGYESVVDIQSLNIEYTRRDGK